MVPPFQLYCIMLILLGPSEVSASVNAPLNKSWEASLLNTSENPFLNVQIETFWKLVSWPNNVLMSEEAKVLPHVFKRFNLHGAAAMLFSVQKGKGLKEWKKSCCVHLAAIMCCNSWLRLQITAISPSNAWNGRGFRILLFVCVIPVSYGFWLGT